MKLSNKIADKLRHKTYLLGILGGTATGTGMYQQAKATTIDFYLWLVLLLWIGIACLQSWLVDNTNKRYEELEDWYLLTDDARENLARICRESDREIDRLEQQLANRPDNTI